MMANLLHEDQGVNLQTQIFTLWMFNDTDLWRQGILSLCIKMPESTAGCAERFIKIITSFFILKHLIKSFGDKALKSLLWDQSPVSLRNVYLSVVSWLQENADFLSRTTTVYHLSAFYNQRKKMGGVYMFLTPLSGSQSVPKFVSPNFFWNYNWS